MLNLLLVEVTMIAIFPRAGLLAVLICTLALGPIWSSPVFAAGKHVAGDKALIEISSTTRGAKVYVNDEEVGEVPLSNPIEVKPGQTYSIRVQKRGFAPVVETVLAGAGQTSTVEADLVPTGGIVKINCNIVRAQVLLNGKAIGRTPFDGDVEPGVHKLQIATAGYLPDERQLLVKAGEETSVQIDLKPVPAAVEKEDKSILGKWWFWSAIGVVVIGGVTGGVLATRTIHESPGQANAVVLLP